MGSTSPPHPLGSESRARAGWLFAIAAIIGLVWLVRPYAAFGDNLLFVPASSDKSIAPVVDENAGVVRSRVVRLNWSALRPASAVITLNPFEDVRLTAVRERVDRTGSGDFVWVGRLLDEAQGLVYLSVAGDTASGTITIDGVERYLLSTTSDGVQVVREVDVATQIEPDGPDTLAARPPLSPGDASTDAPMCEEDGSVIDVMVVYTPAARDAVGGTFAMEALINQRISQMIEANSVSGVPFKWQLVYSMEVDYAESGNIATDLQSLQEGVIAPFAAVHAARDTYKADLVGMLLANGNNNSCGLAYQLNTTGAWFEAFGYSVTALEYPGPPVCNSLTLAHEYGHGLGNGHDRDHASGAPLNAWSYGYQDPGESFRTIMAYNCPGGCPRVNHWSNPDVTFSGLPTGIDHAANPSRSADNARSMNSSSTLVSNFRANCANLPPTATPTDTPVPSPTPTATETPIPADTPEATPEPTMTATATLMPTDTATPTQSPTATATTTPPPTGTAAATATAVPTLQSTATATATPVPNGFTATPTRSATATPTSQSTLPINATSTPDIPVRYRQYMALIFGG